MADRKFTVRFSGEAEVTVRDDRVILRVTENRDGHDRPESDPQHDAEHAWRRVLYNMSTEKEVLAMLVWNAAANGVRQANRLDGWADLDRDAASVDIERIEIEDYSDA